MAFSTLRCPKRSPSTSSASPDAANEVAATDPGGWFTSEAPRQLVGYTYTDKPIYRPGHTVHLKSVLRWRERDAVIPFDRPTAEMSVSDTNDKVVFRQTLNVDEFGAIKASFPVPMTAALGYYNIRVASGDQQATAAFEVQEYRRPEFEVILTPEKRFVVQGEEAVATVQARYYFGQPVANARVAVRRQSAAVLLAVSMGRRRRRRRRQPVLVRRRPADRRQIFGSTPRDAARFACPPPWTTTAATSACESRRKSWTPAVAKSAATPSSTPRTEPSCFPRRPADMFSAPRRRSGQRARDRLQLAILESGMAARVVLERMTYPSGRYNEPTATEVGQQTVTTGADGTANASLTLPSQPGSFRIRAIAACRTIGRSSDETWLWVPGGDEHCG